MTPRDVWRLVALVLLPGAAVHELAHYALGRWLGATASEVGIRDVAWWREPALEVRHWWPEGTTWRRPAAVSLAPLIFGLVCLPATVAGSLLALAADVSVAVVVWVALNWFWLVALSAGDILVVRDLRAAA